VDNEIRPTRILSHHQVAQGRGLVCTGWKLRDIRGFVAGMRFSLEQLLPEIVQYDPWAEETRFELPVFIFQGETDVLTTSSMARALFNEIVAPIKHMELIPGAGHFAAFLQPDLFLEQLLTYVRPLAFASGTEALHKA
jgi:pimeloyl-ACP methyl ester carboxylesterase